MRKVVATLALAVSAAVPTPSAGAAESPHRIVSLNVCADELLLALRLPPEPLGCRGGIAAEQVAQWGLGGLSIGLAVLVVAWPSWAAIQHDVGPVRELVEHLKTIARRPEVLERRAVVGNLSIATVDGLILRAEGV